MIRRNEKKKRAEKGSKRKFEMFDIKNGIITTSITTIQNQMVEKMNMNVLSGQGRHTV